VVEEDGDLGVEGEVRILMISMIWIYFLRGLVIGEWYIREGDIIMREE
jgi:hypothetical protein